MPRRRRDKGWGPGARSIPDGKDGHFTNGSHLKDPKLVSKTKRQRKKVHPNLRGLAELASEHGLTLPRELGRVLARNEHTEVKARKLLTKQFLHQFPNDSADKIEARVNKAIDMQFLLEVKKIREEKIQ